MIRSRGRIAPVLVGTLIVALVVGVVLIRSGDRNAPDPDRPPAFSRVEELRAAVSHCTEDLAGEQARFDAHDRAVDSLRAAVHAYESDERTVPAAEFDAYLEVFDAYNESVRDWHERAEALQSSWQECRALAERHNELVDSLSGGPRVEPILGTG